METTWSLDDLYRDIAHHWRTLAGVAAALILLAVLAFTLWPDKYSTTAVLTVEPITVGQVGGSGSVNMDTEKVVATSTEVLGRAAKALPGSDIVSLREATEVTVPRGSQVLQFTFTSGTAEGAAAGANAVANAYGDQRVANAQRVVTEATDNITARIVDLEVQVEEAKDGSETERALQLQIQTLQEQLASLSSATFYSGTLVSPATAPADSDKPSLPTFLAAGLFLGGLLGAFAALIHARTAARRDRTSDASGRPAAPARTSGPPQPATSKRKHPSNARAAKSAALRAAQDRRAASTTGGVR
ncbi:hypothetical protein ACFFGH_24860 [Lysobacter korlensis]|uniref:Polysaccharide chain length determinant N-terminal domain-containing protein n=1 Tax=Lysobacter korlensis TaxID=553636 RepID=A0ABV6RX84_9GAMM